MPPVPRPVCSRLLTMVRECFHLVSLFRILSRLMQENRFRQQNWLLSPASCGRQKKKINHRLINNKTQIQNTRRRKSEPSKQRCSGSLSLQEPYGESNNTRTKLSAVSSGSSCTTQCGKSSTEMLQRESAEEVNQRRSTRSTPESTSVYNTRIHRGPHEPKSRSTYS